MRYLKLFENYQTIKEIKQFDGQRFIMTWLNKYGVKNYIINDDLTVDVDGDVMLSKLKLTNIPVQFRAVNGSFYCRENELTSFEGCPIEIKGNFICWGNKITSFEHSPKKIGWFFEYSRGSNIISEDNHIKSFEFLSPDIAKKGLIHNQYDYGKNQGSFSCYQSTLNKYWENILENQPEQDIFQHLIINSGYLATASNQISQKLYNEYIHLGRSDKSGLFSMKN